MPGILHIKLHAWANPNLDAEHLSLAVYKRPRHTQEIAPQQCFDIILPNNDANLHKDGRFHDPVFIGTFIPTKNVLGQKCSEN